MAVRPHRPACLGRRALLLLCAGAGFAEAAADSEFRIAAPTDVTLDYGLFLAGRDVGNLRSFDGPHARRDVTELALLMRELRRQFPDRQTTLVPIDSYQRALVELRTGRISALGTTVWLADLLPLGNSVVAGPAFLEEGEFVVGLYTAPSNYKALAVRQLQGLRTLTAVSNSDWSVDWQTLKTIGFRQISDVKTWRQMVQSVAKGRADILMAPFPATGGLVLEAEGATLLPLNQVAIALRGTRHLAASRSPAGVAIAASVFPALATQVANGSVRRAYRESKFSPQHTSQWPILNI